MTAAVVTVMCTGFLAATASGGEARDNVATGQYSAPGTTHYYPQNTSVPLPAPELNPEADATTPELDTAYPSVASTPDTGGDPGAELRALASTDLVALRGSFDGVWLPQLSSKRPGMVVSGTYYDDAAILADHLALRSSYDDIRLVWSGDWVTFSAPDYWVTMVAQPFSTPEGANGWCDVHGIGATDCYAKRLSTTGAGDGNTVPR